MALALSLSVMAQTGLVFSQCLTFSGQDMIDVNPNLNDGEETNPFIVPEGKAWKIEYASINTSSSAQLYINNFYVAAIGISSGIRPFPIWIKSGDQVKLKYTSNSSGYESYFISILEFNVNQ